MKQAVKYILLFIFRFFIFPNFPADISSFFVWLKLSKIRHIPEMTQPDRRLLAQSSKDRGKSRLRYKPTHIPFQFPHLVASTNVQTHLTSDCRGSVTGDGDDNISRKVEIYFSNVSFTWRLHAVLNNRFYREGSCGCCFLSRSEGVRKGNKALAELSQQKNKQWKTRASL